MICLKPACKVGELLQSAFCQLAGRNKFHMHHSHQLVLTGRATKEARAAETRPPQQAHERSKVDLVSEGEPAMPYQMLCAVLMLPARACTPKPLALAQEASLFW